MKKLIMLSVLILFSCSKDSETSEIILNAPIKQYSLSVSSESGGVVSTSGGVFTEGTLVNIKATANPGYSFTGWSNGSTTNPLPITMTSDISITANFSLIPVYIITVLAEDGGSVSSEGGEYQQGTQLTLTATPDEGYEFSGWSDGSTEATRVITVSENLTLTASFSDLIINYTLTVSSGEGGSVNSEGGEYQEGTEVTLTATPNEGYEFSSWSDGNTDQSRTITISQNTTLTANFSENTQSTGEITPSYTLTVNAGAGGSVSSTGGTYDEGVQVTISATPDSGYSFSSWSDGSTDQSRTITISQNTTLTANFTENTTSSGGGSSGSSTTGSTTTLYTLSVTAGAGGIVNTTGGEYEVGTNVTLTATPNTGYTFTGWSGNVTGTDTSLTITINGNTSITANFEAITYTLTVNAGTGGSVSSNGGTYASGTQVTLSATPDTGYAFSSWSDGSTDQSRTITITQETTLTANFESIIVTYTLNVNAGTGGTVSSSLDNGTYDSGTQVTISATPDTGYAFSSWSDGSTDQSRTITLYEDTTLTANFEAAYTLTVNKRCNSPSPYCDGSVIGGSVSSSGGTYAPGTQVTITATPDSNFVFAFWYDGTTYYNDQTLTITMNSDTTITANFALTSHRLYINAGISQNFFAGGVVTSSWYSGGQTITTESFNTFEYGTEITLTAIPDEGYEFSGWSDGSTDASRTITITEEITLTANFEEIINTYTLTVDAGPGGSVSSSSGTYESGTLVNVSATANPGYEFYNWTVNGNPHNWETGSSSFTLTIGADTTYTANFIDVTGTVYAVTVEAEAGGSVSWYYRTGTDNQDPSTTVIKRIFYTTDKINLVAGPSAGNTFVGWECTSGCSGNTFGTENNQSLIIGTSDISVKAKFE